MAFARAAPSAPICEDSPLIGEASGRPLHPWIPTRHLKNLANLIFYRSRRSFFGFVGDVEPILVFGRVMHGDAGNVAVRVSLRYHLLPGTFAQTSF